LHILHNIDFDESGSWWVKKETNPAYCYLQLGTACLAKSQVFSQQIAIGSVFISFTFVGQEDHFRGKESRRFWGAIVV
jgi:hypothetical protein